MFVVATVFQSLPAAPPGEDARFRRFDNRDTPHPFAPAFDDRADWEARAAFLRRQAQVAQGLWPMPARPPLKPVIHGKIDRGDYTVEKVYFASLPGHYVSGNLYRPTNRTGKLPAVLTPYGHWPNGRFIWRSDESVNKDLASGAEKLANAARSPLQANCAMLARMGCIVFHYDMVGYCDSRAIEHSAGFVDAESILRLQSFMGLQTWNSVRAMDFVLGLGDVDPSRVAVTGSSSGGTQTIALNAVDDRAAVAFPIVMVSMNMQGGCICENAPLYRVDTNNVELASLPAPRPQGMAAANDWTHDFLRRGLPEMRSIWRLYGREADVVGQHFDYPHNHNLHSRTALYEFLNDRLKLGWPIPVVEADFEPIPPEQLSVFDAAHPQPVDATDASGVRAWMRQSADDAMAAMSGQDRHAMLRGALEAMLVDAMPTAGDVEAFAAAGGSGFLSRRSAEERIPFRLFTPAAPSGGVVVWADSGGIALLSGADGKPVPAVQRLLDAGLGSIAIEPFMSPAFGPSKPEPPPAKPMPPYAAFQVGYRRSVIANRVRDLLTTIAWAKGLDGVMRVHLVGTSDAGPWAVLARAAAGDAVDRAAIDLGGFDFDQITDPADPLLLPGALKYGGIDGFLPLFAGRPTLLTHARFSDTRTTASSVEVDPQPRPTEAMIDWLLRP